MMPKQLLAPVGALFIGGLASAAIACPTASDMAGGVVFTLDDGLTEVHTAINADWVQILADFGEGEAALYDYYRGLYLYKDVPVVDGQPLFNEAETLATLAETGQWAVPQPNATWTNTTINGGTATATGLQTIELSGCSYDAFEVAFQYTSDPGYTETYLYLPAFGTSLLIEAADEVSIDRYTYTGIGVVE